MALWDAVLRRHWNYALGQRLDWLNRTRSPIDRCSIVAEPIGEISERVDYYFQSSELRQTKQLFPEYKDIYADCQQQNLMRLDKAWKRWLVPDKAGKHGGRARFKKRGDICSFTFPRVNKPKAGAHLTGNILKLSKIGEMEVILHRPMPDGFTLKQATLISKADGWYVSLSLEDGTVPELLPVDEVKSAVGYSDIAGNSYPINFRIYDKREAKTKNDYFIEMLQETKSWGVKPDWVTGDSGYSSLANLKFREMCRTKDSPRPLSLRNEEVRFLSGVAENRRVPLERGKDVQATLDQNTRFQTSATKQSIAIGLSK